MTYEAYNDINASRKPQSSFQLQGREFNTRIHTVVHCKHNIWSYSGQDWCQTSSWWWKFSWLLMEMNDNIMVDNPANRKPRGRRVCGRGPDGGGWMTIKRTCKGWECRRRVIGARRPERTRSMESFRFIRRKWGFDRIRQPSPAISWQSIGVTEEGGVVKPSRKWPGWVYVQPQRT